jgi:hypothetical protein
VFFGTRRLRGSTESTGSFTGRDGVTGSIGAARTKCRYLWKWSLHAYA